MTVYKMYLKLIKRNSKAILLYMIIFTAVFIGFGVINSLEKPATSFEAAKPPISIIDKDQSDLSQNLKEYLGNLTTIDTPDTIDAAKDSMFFGITAAYIDIPEGFADSFSNQQPSPLEVVQRQDETNAMLVQQYVNSYLQSVASYQQTTDLSLDEIHQLILADSQNKTEITILQNDVVKSNDNSILRQLFFNYLAYIALSAIILMVGVVMLSFNNKEVRKRNLIAPIKASSITAQMLLGNLTFVLGIWAVLISIICIFGQNMFNAIGLTYMLNSLVFFIIALAIAFLMSNLIINQEHASELISAVSNIAGLGLCFLGGAFVPQRLIGESVLNISRFLPSYWYVLVNDKLAEMSQPTLEIFQYIGIQALFAVALIILTFVVYKHKRVQESI